MSLLEGTAFGAAFLLPGVISLAIALTPKGRAIRPSSLSTRAVGLVTFSALDWFLALLMYSWWCSSGSHGEYLASLLLDGDSAARKTVLAELFSFPPAVWKFLVLLGGATLATGAIFALFQNAVITGMAIRDFKLKCHSRSWWRQEWFAFSRRIEMVLAWVRLASLLQPIGAAYWLVIQKAADYLRTGKDDPKVILVYADVLQGEEVVGNKIGVLYTGAVKHLVCETDGNIVFLLLVEAKRWTTTGSEQGWKPIRESEAFAVEGQSIRNISFRLYEKTGIVSVREDAWPTEEPIAP